MFGPGLDDNGRGPHETMKVGAFAEGDDAGAEDLPAGLAVDMGSDASHRMKEFDMSPAFDAQVPSALDIWKR